MLSMLNGCIRFVCKHFLFAIKNDDFNLGVYINLHERTVKLNSAVCVAQRVFRNTLVRAVIGQRYRYYRKLHVRFIHVVLQICVVFGA